MKMLKSCLNSKQDYLPRSSRPTSRVLRILRKIKYKINEKHGQKYSVTEGLQKDISQEKRAIGK